MTSDQVLAYWHCIEFFNKFDLDNRIKDSQHAKLPSFYLPPKSASARPWEKYRANARDIYLVPFDVARINELIYGIPLPADEDNPDWQRDFELAPEGLTCFAKLHVHANGTPDFDTFSVSALPWAAGMLQRGELTRLCAQAFEASVNNLKQDLLSAWTCRADEDFNPALLAQFAAILREWAGFAPAGALDAWVEVLGDERTKRAAEVPAIPEPAPEDEEDDAPEEILILNSFYYHDLKFAAKTLLAEAPGNPLRAYLGEQAHAKIDLDSAEGQQAILASMQPRHFNEGRWPASPGMLQSLMQQFALNKMRELQPGELVSVNGPPGTGKTTLVKDLIADVIVQRAGVLASLNRAADGIAPKGEMITFGKDAAKLVPRLIPALTGFEIVVASSNNGAVENLSLELPQLSGIADELKDTLHYFQEVATKYAGTQGNLSWRPPRQPVWGLVSAALGKSKNRARFQQVFGYRSAAPSHAAGEQFLSNEKVDFPVWDEAGAMSYWHFVKTRRPAASFAQAKQRFTAAKAELAAYSATMADLHDRWKRLLAAWDGARHALGLVTRLEPDTGLHPQAAELARRLAALERRHDALALQLWPRPFRWLMRWFRKQALADWEASHTLLATAAMLQADLLAVIELQAQCGQVQLWDGQPLDTRRNQEKAFYHGERYNQLRNQLFVAAMDLHQAFFVEAAAPSTVFPLSKLLSKRVSGGDPLVLWQWLFMLVPVVSSTFASIRTQFRGVGPGSFGWLIIDEAGQATPQSAVGAILRARRVVAVGDPLQIEPVVGMPWMLTERLGEYWLGADASRYSANQHSVQTLADRAHPYGVRHPSRPDEFIGIPLVMHRRCDNPMFDIANAIAYDKRMLHAKQGGHSAHPVLGESAWWHVAGAGENGKYVPAQGELLFGKLIELYLAAGTPEIPAVYIITPFREVKAGLRELLGDPQNWSVRLGNGVVQAPRNLKELANGIGTVHTFQGKEADIVFFVLGCDDSKRGAMRWACASPNLLNVAVTRARRHCYVIGDRALWGNLNHFDVALRELNHSKH